MKFIAKLNIERKKQKLSMFALSKKADVAYTTVWNLENGFHKRVSIELKEKVAHALGKNIWEIFPDVKRLIIRWIKEFKEWESKP